MILALLGYNSMQNYIHTEISKKALSEYIKNKICEPINNVAENSYKNFKYKGNDAGKSEVTGSGNKNELLNLYPLIYESSSEKALLTGQIFQEILKVLFYDKENLESLVEESSLILDKITLLNENRNFSDPVQMSEVDLSDENLQETLYGILNWKNGAKLNLAELSTFQKQKKTWLYHAPPLLVCAFFGGNSQSTINFIDFRNKLYLEIKQQIEYGEKWDEFKTEILFRLNEEIKSIMNSLGRSQYLEIIESSDIKHSIKPPD